MHVGRFIDTYTRICISDLRALVSHLAKKDNARGTGEHRMIQKTREMATHNKTAFTLSNELPTFDRQAGTCQCKGDTRSRGDSVHRSRVIDAGRSRPEHHLHLHQCMGASDLKTCKWHACSSQTYTYVSEKIKANQIAANNYTAVYPEACASV